MKTLRIERDQLRMNIVEAVEAKFRTLFVEQPLLVRSPGRVNLIGEHTDYNQGYVLPGAIEKAIYFAVAPGRDTSCNLLALDLNDQHRFSIHDLSPSPKRWPNYLMGVVDQLIKAGCALEGFNCVFGGDIPVGAGLSSSAAIETGLAFALNSIFQLRLDNLSLVKFAQKAENEFVGVQCGIMDQFVNIFGHRGEVLRLDCRSLEHVYYPFTHNLSIVLFDTRVPHALASSEYNRRRVECGQGAEILRQFHPAVSHLRDVSPGMLEAHRKDMGDCIFRRCSYVVNENIRVLDACRALASGDLKTFGDLMYITHEGLRNDYEVSCPELDFLVELVHGLPGVYGARMMGGGFGGCTINLIVKDAVTDIVSMVTARYAPKFGREPGSYITSIGEGTSLISAA